MNRRQAPIGYVRFLDSSDWMRYARDGHAQTEERNAAAYKVCRLRRGRVLPFVREVSFGLGLECYLVEHGDHRHFVLKEHCTPVSALETLGHALDKEAV